MGTECLRISFPDSLLLTYAGDNKKLKKKNNIPTDIDNVKQIWINRFKNIIAIIHPKSEQKYNKQTNKHTYMKHKLYLRAHLKHVCVWILRVLDDNRLAAAECVRDWVLAGI